MVDSGLNAPHIPGMESNAMDEQNQFHVNVARILDRMKEQQAALKKRELYPEEIGELLSVAKERASSPMCAQNTEPSNPADSGHIKTDSSCIKPDSRFMTVSDAAKMLGRSRATVYAYIKKGLLSQPTLYRGCVRFEDVRRLIDGDV